MNFINMTASEEELKSVKAEIRSLIVSCPVGLNVNRLERDYKEQIGKPLPFGYFGFRTTIEFLKSMPDVVHIKQTSCGSLLVPVESQLTSHINSLVSKQRPSKRRRIAPRKPRMSTVFGNRRYYQRISQKRRKPFMAHNYDIISDKESLDSFHSEDLDNLSIDWVTDPPDQNDYDLLIYGQTKRYTPPKRPSPVAAREAFPQSEEVPRSGHYRLQSHLSEPSDTEISDGFNESDSDNEIYGQTQRYIPIKRLSPDCEHDTVPQYENVPRPQHNRLKSHRTQPIDSEMLDYFYDSDSDNEECDQAKPICKGRHFKIRVPDDPLTLKLLRQKVSADLLQFSEESLISPDKNYKNSYVDVKRCPTDCESENPHTLKPLQNRRRFSQVVDIVPNCQDSALSPNKNYQNGYVDVKRCSSDCESENPHTLKPLQNRRRFSQVVNMVPNCQDSALSPNKNYQNGYVDVKGCSSDCKSENPHTLKPLENRKRLSEVVDMVPNCQDPELSPNKSRKNGNEIVVSEEHETYLSALINGIVLDPKKVNEPYKRLLSVKKPFNIVKTDLNNSVNIPPTESISSRCKCLPNSDVLKSNNELLYNTKTNFIENTYKKSKNDEDKFVKSNSTRLAEVTCSSLTKSVYSEFIKNETSSEEDTKTISGSSKIVGTLKNDSPLDKPKTSFINGSLTRFGRGAAIKNILHSYERDQKMICNNERGMGRGELLQYMQKKYFQKLIN